MISTFDAKLIAITLFSYGSLFSGFLPGLLNLGNRVRNSVLVSVVQCFGGGVLFATSVVHLLPDTRKSLEQWGEFVFCMGFFLMYFTDVIVDSCSSDTTEGEDHDSAAEKLLGGKRQSSNYGSVQEDAACSSSAVGSGEEVEVRREGGEMISKLGLLLAFSVHSFLEGLVIGVQTSPTSVFLLVSAVSCHKFLMTFCLGAALLSDGPVLDLLTPLSLYVAGSASGIAAGMLLDQGEESIPSSVIPTLQGLAGGTLLYIVLSEILPRERAHSKTLPSPASFLQFGSTLFGFGLMTFLTFAFVDED